MSIYTTIELTKKEAIKKIMIYFLENYDNKEALENILDAILEEDMYNCRIIEQDSI